MYIVTMDNPFYPSVYYCNDIEKARTRRDILKESHHEEDGVNDVKIVIAKVIEVQEIKTHY